MIKTRTVENPADFEELKREWNELHEASVSPCLFLTWEWLFTWWKHLSEDRQLRLVTVRDGRELVAIAPFALRPRRLRRLLPFRSLEFVGAGSVGSNYLDIIIRDGKETEALQGLTGCLAHGHLMLALSDVRHNSCAAATLAVQLAQWHWTFAQIRTNVSPFINLSGHSWESLLGTFGQEHRYRIKRGLKKMDSQFDARLQQVRTEEERPEALAQLVSMHNLRWQERGGSNAFHTSGLRAFHEEFSRLALERGWLRLFVLWLEGKPAASVYGFRFRRTFYFYQSGFDPQYAKLGLGINMLSLTVKSALEEGADEYDFLGGDESYKFHWAGEVRELGRLELYPPGLSGWISRGAMASRHAARRMARRLLPQATADGLSIGRDIAGWEKPHAARAR